MVTKHLPQALGGKTYQQSGDLWEKVGKLIYI